MFLHIANKPYNLSFIVEIGRKLAKKLYSNRKNIHKKDLFGKTLRGVGKCQTGGGKFLRRGRVDHLRERADHIRGEAPAPPRRLASINLW